MNLRDNYEETGKTMPRFAEICEDFSKNTKQIKKIGINIQGLIRTELEKVKDKTPEGQIPFMAVNFMNINDFVYTNKVSDIFLSVTAPELKEDIEKIGMMFEINAYAYAISESAIKTLSRWSGVKGDYFINDNSPLRNMYLLRALYNADPEQLINFVYREDSNGSKKIFGAFGEGHAIVPMRWIPLLVKEEGLSCQWWKINHETTEIITVSTRQGDVLPGVRIINSNTGYSSFTIQAVLVNKINNSYIVIDEAIKKNSKKTEYANLKDDISKMKMLSKAFLDDMLESNVKIEKNQITKIISDIILEMNIPRKWQGIIINDIQPFINKEEFSISEYIQICIDILYVAEDYLDFQTLSDARKNMLKLIIEKIKTKLVA